ncbi:hypothetical protein ACOI1H_00210 [Loktanella sp. DJP18]|uniref:hypothetical protein n=1 Tax=Loktanella sp. DJP18 TaxID=3409788 RepID=UPI003BB6DEFD
MLIRVGTARREVGDGSYRPYSADLLSDTGGLALFGTFIETLPPGSVSSTLPDGTVTRTASSHGA